MSYTSHMVMHVKCDMPACNSELEDADGHVVQIHDPQNEFEADYVTHSLELANWVVVSGGHYCEDHASIPEAMRQYKDKQVPYDETGRPVQDHHTHSGVHGQTGPPEPDQQAEDESGYQRTIGDSLRREAGLDTFTLRDDL